jgi:hypothetical protein
MAVATRRAGIPEASAAIWRWRGGESEAAPPAPVARIRWRGSFQALAGGAVGLALWWLGAKAIATVAFAFAAVILGSALASPTGLYALLQRFFEAGGRVIGRAMTWIVMVPIFYLFFLPFGRLLRRGRRDRLHRHFDVEAKTYWEPHTPVPTSSLERQY